VRKFFAILLLLIPVTSGVWFVASPWFAMKGIRDAAQDGDVAALERRIDFDAVRESTWLQVDSSIRAKEGPLLEQIGGEVAADLAERALERGLNPHSIATLITIGAIADPLLPERLRGKEIEWDVERDGFDRFRGVGRFEDGSAGPVLHFRREGLGWTMIGVDLPQLSIAEQGR